MGDSRYYIVFYHKIIDLSTFFYFLGFSTQKRAKRRGSGTSLKKAYQNAKYLFAL